MLGFWTGVAVGGVAVVIAVVAIGALALYCADRDAEWDAQVRDGDARMFDNESGDHGY